MKKFPILLIFISILFVLTIIVNIPKQIHFYLVIPKTSISDQVKILDYKISGLDLSNELKKINIHKELTLKRGLDLEGGTSITLRANMEEVNANSRESALDSAKEVIERRINLFGVSEPVVQTSKSADDYRVIVEIPGVTDLNQAVNLIGTTAKLTFWEEGASLSGDLKPNSDVPLNAVILLGDNPKKTNLTGSDLKQAEVTFDQNTGAPVVQLSFTSEGADKFADITKRNIGKRLGFALDDVMIDAPVVQSQIVNGDAIISGGFNTEQAKQLKHQLNAGALPVSLEILSQQSIGATLGQDSLDKSLFAGILGFIVIVVFMVSIYGRLGLIASFALLIYTLITLAIFRIIPVTLTLAGIAGFILSIGIAVDANILIFERMKEELRRGMSRKTALELGFSRAWTSIRDSNVASLITSGILYYFGTGPVRGFALTLAIGVLVSMFTAITVTRTILKIYYKN